MLTERDGFVTVTCDACGVTSTEAPATLWGPVLGIGDVCSDACLTLLLAQEFALSPNADTEAHHD